MFKLFISFILLSMVCLSQAANFCVETSDELQFALNFAGINGQDDTIKIESGTYMPTSQSAWAYVFENFDGDHTLHISGGWLTVESNCDSQPSGNSQATIIDGGNTMTPLVIKLDGTEANITIENISFNNGLADSNDRGGGLKFLTFNDYNGIINITRNQFKNNQALYGSALSIAEGNRINVKNNLFVANQATDRYTIEIVQNNKTGVYFTNNTVIHNTGDGVYLFVGGSNSQVMVANNILWDNDSLDLQLYIEGVSYLYHNDIGNYNGTPDFESNNFSTEPAFHSGGFLEYIPALSSPLINSGYHPSPFPLPPPFSQDWSLGTTDVLGKNRVQDNRVDIGAFEATAEVPIFKDGFE